MIIDCILYNGEAECLDIRLHELAEVVDRHVIVEFDKTFTGKPKELHAVSHTDRLFYVALASALDVDDAWLRESYQRMALFEAVGLSGVVADDDIILIGDADEIPSAGAVREAAKQATKGVQVAFDQTLCTYYINNICVNQRWRGTQAVRYDYLKRVTPQGVRDYRNHAPYVVENGGWHWSSLVLNDPVGRLTAKIQAFSHQECNRSEVLDPENIRRRVALGQDIQGRTDVSFKVERNTPLPKYVSENKERFKTLFYPGSV